MHSLRSKRTEGDQAACCQTDDGARRHQSRDAGEASGHRADEPGSKGVETDQRSGLGVESVRLVELSLQPFLRLLPDERSALWDSATCHVGSIESGYDTNSVPRHAQVLATASRTAGMTSAAKRSIWLAGSWVGQRMKASMPWRASSVNRSTR